MRNKSKQEIGRLFSPIEEYDPEWDYNPGELIRLAVWHKNELPQEAITKIKKVCDNILGRDEKPGQWALDQREFEDLVDGYGHSQTIPSEIEGDLVEIIKQYKNKQP